ncbi:MAG: FAD-binding protein [Melioribacteraceae bacterium]
MIKETEIVVPLDFINDSEKIRELSALKIGIDLTELNFLKIRKRSIDARSKEPIFRFSVIAYINEDPPLEIFPIKFKPVTSNQTCHIIGSGPAGLFAALKCIELNIKPIIFERGKDIQSRRRDLKAIQQDGIVNPDSNYCFGEGGAGTYSDGKLYTRSKKRGDVDSILSLFVFHGATPDILIDAHPHIGSNKLPKIINAIRDTIIQCGGVINFDCKLTGMTLDNSQIKTITINELMEHKISKLILATGHSARDIYYLLNRENILIESKPFAIGVRIEHPQRIIDKIQYHSEIRHENLPASAYNFACQIGEKGVYSFCMCPGGIIVPASTEDDELVLNGMSVSRRDSPYANSGFVVTIDDKDWGESNNIFAGLEYQSMIEKSVFNAGGGKQKSPAQRITDFVENKISSTLPGTSYIPGIVSSPLHEILPKNISVPLQKALLETNKSMRGYFTNEALILAAETRTSSPIRIPRDNESKNHVEIKNLYPCGEGAGYAGGIISAAIDGQKTAEAIAKSFYSKL